MEAAAIEAIEYAADLKTNYDDIPTAEGLPIQPDIEIEKTETKEEKLKKISFIFDNEDEERDIMDGIAASINKYIDYSNKILTPEEMRLPFMELMNAANREEKNFNYQKALAFYQLALTMKEDDNFPLMVSRIYVKTAKCYEKLSDWFNAVKYYEIALEYFVNSGDKEKFNEMRLAVANIFYNTYKHDKAEKLLLDILNPNEDISNELKIKARLLLASVNNKDLKEVYNNYKSAFTLADNTVNRKVLAELYFKFAAVCDELDETETAIKLYKRCTDIPDNSYLSSAMTNLAMIYDDTGSTDLAVKYYLESLNIDEKNKNLSGVYESAIRLAKYYKRKEPEKSLDFYRKAMNAAKELGEPYYLMNINVEYGDFCADKREFSKALKAYIKAYARAKNNSMSEYKTKIEQRLRDLKLRLGDEAFKKLELEVTQNG
jgi:tetratricopeptide (TPR) repeat protein